ncbi:MAG: D-alanyl-D-alanine carboxypeptidase [Deltaproteobacteria bacterium]|nr:D-alanyl-D-alanine carboxypeptidase [Deltaproteobacteria bacterium]
MTKHRGGFFPLIFLLLLGAVSPAWSGFPEERLTAHSAFLVDAVTGHVLYEREPDLPLPPASTTKIITALVALESGRLENDLLRVSKTATHVPSSKLYLRPGQAMNIEHLLYSLLLSSANDASLVLAEGIAGSVSRFAEMMTEKARSIGALNSHFTNPHGLTSPGHYSTARDLAIIFNHAMKNPRFREIVQTKTSSVKTISGGKTKKFRNIAIRNHNRLLWNFEGAIGGKTGYTFAARKCFVGGVSRDGVTLIVSILGSRDLWGDTRKLLEYGLENYADLKTSRVAAPLPSLNISGRLSSPLFSRAEEKQVFSHHGYVLQVASFKEQGRAESLLDRIRDGGFPTFVEPAAMNDGETSYRVRVGPYADLTQAQEAAREIENKSGFRPIILPVLPLSASPEKRS